MESISLIFLAGGIGTRMRTHIPKQYLFLNQRPIIEHSLETFAKFKEINEFIIVAEPLYHHFFSHLPFPIKFASPGPRRQDSVYNGLSLVGQNEWVCIHDSARPLINQKIVEELFKEGKKHGAATLGVPIKVTLKECNSNGIVERTLDRSKIWDIQTPQFLSKNLIQKGFEYALKHDLSVTDDVSLAELINHPVKIVNSIPANIKITTPEDLIFAETMIKNNSYA